jgi:hypothetical protein
MAVDAFGLPRARVMAGVSPLDVRSVIDVFEVAWIDASPVSARATAHTARTVVARVVDLTRGRGAGFGHVGVSVGANHSRSIVEDAVAAGDARTYPRPAAIGSG